MVVKPKLYELAFLWMRVVETMYRNRENRSAIKKNKTLKKMKFSGSVYVNTAMPY